jgi:hypothetical protein
VPRDIRQGFLDDPVDGCFDERVHPPVRLPFDADRDARARRKPLGQELERRPQAEVVQDRRAELVGETPQPVLDLVHVRRDLPQPLAIPGSGSSRLISARARWIDVVI